jgi:Fe-S cluster biosynthesis and repair protein YggX
MNHSHDIPTGPQLYLLSEEGYEELQHVQTMLLEMAKVSYHENDAILAIRRADLYYFFEEVSAQIGDALERVGKENALGPHKLMQ